MRTILKPFDEIESNLSCLHFLNYCQDALNDPKSVELKGSSKELLKDVISYGSYLRLNVAMRFEEALNSDVDLKILQALGLIEPYQHRSNHDYRATRLGYVFYTHHYSKPLMLRCKTFSKWICYVAVGISVISAIAGIITESSQFPLDGCLAVALSLVSLASVFLCNVWFDRLPRSTTEKRYICLILTCPDLNKTLLANITSNSILVDRFIRSIDKNAFP